jgi:hypothetical protein
MALESPGTGGRGSPSSARRAEGDTRAPSGGAGEPEHQAAGEPQDLGGGELNLRADNANEVEPELQEAQRGDDANGCGVGFAAVTLQLLRYSPPVLCYHALSSQHRRSAPIL